VGLRSLWQRPSASPVAKTERNRVAKKDNRKAVDANVAGVVAGAIVQHHHRRLV
jgi:hypothetical protein